MRHNQILDVANRFLEEQFMGHSRDEIQLKLLILIEIGLTRHRQPTRIPVS